MSDEKTQQMLAVANQLTAEDLALLCGQAPVAQPVPPARTPNRGRMPRARTARERDAPPAPAEAQPDLVVAAGHVQVKDPQVTSVSQARRVPRGEYERRRSRESKVSTRCLGQERLKHEWWPVGTELQGRIGEIIFTALVIENPQVKSGRSLQITSGPATDRVCISPTGAALEATESYRRDQNLGRAGGVTNGWEFWKPSV